MVDPINQFIRETNYQNYLIASDDLIVTQEALDVVEELLWTNYRATGYCRIADDSPFYNVTKKPLTKVVDKWANTFDYHFYRVGELAKLPTDQFFTWFGGWTLTGMRRMEWLVNPFRVHEPSQMQSDYATCLAVDGVFASDKKAYCQHYKQQELSLDPDLFIVGKIKPTMRLEKEYNFVNSSDMVFALSSTSTGGTYGCDDYDCTSSPCGCEPPDCTSPNTPTGIMITKQITDGDDDGYYVCDGPCTSFSILFGDYWSEV